MRLTLALLGCLFVPSRAVLAQDKPVFTPMEWMAAQQDPNAFTIDDDSVGIVWEKPGAKPAQGLPPAPGGGSPGDGIVMVDAIINIGQKLWTIIKENKPIVDIRTQWASATPEGITHWSQLSGWDTPEGTTYGFYAKNMYGTKVINVKYQVLRTPGGSYKGKGRYLTGVTVEPLLVEVAWGYKLTLTADVPSVTNADKTGENPLAGMMLNLKWRIETPVKDSQGTGVYYVRGDGLFVEVGGPFKKTAMVKLKEKLADFKAGFN